MHRTPPITLAVYMIHTRGGVCRDSPDSTLRATCTARGPVPSSVESSESQTRRQSEKPRRWSKKIEGETKKKGEKLPTPTKAASGGKVDGEEADEQEVKIDHRATLVRHSKAINVVRFSKDGRILASAGECGQSKSRG